MTRGWRMGVIGVAAVVGLGLQACASRSADRGRSYDGYGGSGYLSDRDLRDAREECVQAARHDRDLRDVSVLDIDVTGPDTAQVSLEAKSPLGSGQVPVSCTYDLRTGRAFVR